MSKSKQTYSRKNCKNKRRKTMRGGDEPAEQVVPVKPADQVVPVVPVKPSDPAVPAVPTVPTVPTTSSWYSNLFGTSNPTAAPTAKGWFWGGKKRRHKSKSCRK